MSRKTQSTFAKVNLSITPLTFVAPQEGVCGILSESQGVDARPGASKLCCPFCGNSRLAIKRDDTLAKCFHPSCGKFITRWSHHTDYKRGLYRVHENQFRAGLLPSVAPASCRTFPMRLLAAMSLVATGVPKVSQNYRICQNLGRMHL